MDKKALQTLIEERLKQTPIPLSPEKIKKKMNLLSGEARALGVTPREFATTLRPVVRRILTEAAKTWDQELSKF